jgi:hypothetical protein
MADYSTLYINGLKKFESAQNLLNDSPLASQMNLRT